MKLFLTTSLLACIGKPLPYQASQDNTLLVILLICFFITCLSLSYSRKFLLDLGHHFIENKAHISAFSTSTNTEIHSLFLLILQSCTLLAVTIFLYLNTLDDTLVTAYKSNHVVGILGGFILLILFFKWLLYSFLGWVFKRKETTAIWLESYATIIYYLGLLLYPIVLYLLFYNTHQQLLKYVVIGIFILAKSLILYKGLKLFSNNLYGHVLLILYFCALEIIPYALLYRGMNKYIMF